MISAFLLATFFCLFDLGKGERTMQGETQILIFKKNQSFWRGIRESLCQGQSSYHQPTSSDWVVNNARNILSLTHHSHVLSGPKDTQIHSCRACHARLCQRGEVGWRWFGIWNGLGWPGVPQAGWFSNYGWWDNSMMSFKFSLLVRFKFYSFWFGFPLSILI